MVVVPAAIPVTTPVDALIVAADGLLLIHVPPPPEVGLVKVMVEPGHTEPAPTMAPGDWHNTVMTTWPLPVAPEYPCVCTIAVTTELGVAG